MFFQGMMYLMTLVFGGWLIAHRTDGAGRSGDVCALYWHFYQSDPDSGRADRNDAERVVRISVDSWMSLRQNRRLWMQPDAEATGKISKGMCVMKMFPFITVTMTHWFLMMFLLISRQENRSHWSDLPEVERQPSVLCFRDFTM